MERTVYCGQVAWFYVAITTQIYEFLTLRKTGAQSQEFNSWFNSWDTKKSREFLNWVAFTFNPLYSNWEAVGSLAWTVTMVTTAVWRRAWWLHDKYETTIITEIWHHSKCGRWSWKPWRWLHFENDEEANVELHQRKYCKCYANVCDTLSKYVYMQQHRNINAGSGLVLVWGCLQIFKNNS